MRMRTVDPFGPTSPQEILRFESRRGIKLPEEYKQFLLNSNGGRPVPDGFDVPGWPHVTSALHTFYGIHEGKSNKLDKACDVYAGRIPADLLPIGSDDFGNAICLGIAGKRRSKVYFWDHEDERDDQDYGNVYLLANSLGEFLGKLKELEE